MKWHYKPAPGRGSGGSIETIPYHYTNFGGLHFRIYYVGPFCHKLWAHDICSERYYTRRGAKRAALEHAVEYLLVMHDGKARITRRPGGAAVPSE